MQLGILQKETHNQNTPQKKQSVFIDPNPKRERIFLDANGNEIDMKTKTIIKQAEQE